MENPSGKPAAGAADAAAAVKPTKIPVEQLIESMKPETPLVVDAATGGGGGSTGASPASK